MAALAAALAVAGCGGGSGASNANGGAGNLGKPNASTLPGGSGRAPHTGTSRQAFIHAADGICRQAHSDIGHVSDRFRALVQSAEHGRLSARDYYRRAADLTGQMAGLALRALQAVGALARPPDPRIAEYLTLSRSSTQLLSLDGEALRRGDNRAASRLTARAAALTRRAHDLALRIGFHSCGGAGR